MPAAEDLAERLLSQSIAVMEAAAVWLGREVGWYDALRSGAPFDGAKLAAATGTDQRYAQEWLEQQAAAGILRHQDGRFTLPREHAEVLLDRDSGNWVEPLVRQVLTAVTRLPELAQVYRDGGGLPWAAYGEAMSQSQGDVNRPTLLHALPEEWVPQMPELHQRLAAGGRVVDVACGQAWSAIGLATAYPDIEVHGYDMDPVAVAAAARNAAEHGVSDRVHVHHREIDGPLPDGPFDVAIAVECVHDMPYPAKVLAGVRASCVADAVVVVIDEAGAPDLVTPADDVQRLLYGFSLLVCLPDSLSHDGSVGTGAVIRPAVMDRYAREAGFAGAVPLEVRGTGFWRCYRLPLDA